MAKSAAQSAKWEKLAGHSCWLASRCLQLAKSTIPSGCARSWRAHATLELPAPRGRDPQRGLRLIGNDGRGLDLDFRLTLDQRDDLHHGHDREVPAQHGTIRRSDILLLCEILVPAR